MIVGCVGDGESVVFFLSMKVQHQFEEEEEEERVAREFFTGLYGNYWGSLTMDLTLC